MFTFGELVCHRLEIVYFCILCFNIIKTVTVGLRFYSITPSSSGFCTDVLEDDLSADRSM